MIIRILNLGVRCRPVLKRTMLLVNGAFFFLGTLQTKYFFLGTLQTNTEISSSRNAQQVVSSRIHQFSVQRFESAVIAQNGNSRAGSLARLHVRSTSRVGQETHLDSILVDRLVRCICSQHIWSCTRKTELALEEIYLEFHRVTRSRDQRKWRQIRTVSW